MFTLFSLLFEHFKLMRIIQKTGIAAATKTTIKIKIEQ